MGDKGSNMRCHLPAAKCCASRIMILTHPHLATFSTFGRRWCASLFVLCQASLDLPCQLCRQTSEQRTQSVDTLCSCRKVRSLLSPLMLSPLALYGSSSQCPPSASHTWAVVPLSTALQHRTNFLPRKKKKKKKKTSPKKLAILFSSWTVSTAVDSARFRCHQFAVRVRAQAPAPHVALPFPPWPIIVPSLLTVFITAQVLSKPLLISCTMKTSENMFVRYGYRALAAHV